MAGRRSGCLRPQHGDVVIHGVSEPKWGFYGGIKFASSSLHQDTLFFKVFRAPLHGGRTELEPRHRTEETLWRTLALLLGALVSSVLGHETRQHEVGRLLSLNGFGTFR